MKLRFTGEFPPLDLWKQFPNWEPALDEEYEPDQDEGTLRPSEQQRFVVDFGFTAGEVEQANGQRLPALLGMNGGPDGLTAFTSDNDGWMIQRLGNPSRWVCTVEDWLPEAERSPSVSFEDASVFPLRVRSQLPERRTGKPLEFLIHADGTMTDHDLDLLGILRIAHETSAGGAGLSLREALQRTQYTHCRATMGRADLRGVLNAEPGLLEEWLAYSEDKRTSGGWYILPSGEIGRVGDADSREFYACLEEAVAEYVVRELAFWADLQGDG